MILSSYKDLESAISNLNKSSLIRLVYISTIRKSSKSDPHLFERIRSHDEDYNRKHNIKGMLCNDNKYFIQCLEGDQKSLLPLMLRIFRDKRHRQVKIILLKEIDDYSFVDWHMYSFNLDRKTWSDDSLKSRSAELLDFLPLKPLTWSDWYIEHFLQTMRKFDDPNQEYDDKTGVYNVIRDTGSKYTNIFDSVIFHGFLVLLVIILILILAKHKYLI